MHIHFLEIIICVCCGMITKVTLNILTCSFNACINNTYSNTQLLINGNMAKHKQTDDVNYEEDLDCIDFNNYKGMFFQDDPGQKFQDDQTGAHFDYKDMCRRLFQLKKSMPEEHITVESSLTEHTEDIDENIGGDSKRHKINESSTVFKALQAMQLHALDKESRNIPQGLPQQGYSTGFKKEIGQEIKNQFCTHINNRESIRGHGAGTSLKTKYADNQRANNGPIKENILKSATKSAKKPAKTEEHGKEKRKQVFVDL